MCQVFFIIFIMKWRYLFSRTPDSCFLREKSRERDQTVLLIGAGLSRPSPRREEPLEGDDEKVPLGREKYEPSRGDGGHTVEWQQGPVWQWKSRWTISGSLQENL